MSCIRTHDVWVDIRYRVGPCCMCFFCFLFVLDLFPGCVQISIYLEAFDNPKLAQDFNPIRCNIPRYSNLNSEPHALKPTFSRHTHIMRERRKTPLEHANHTSKAADTRHAREYQQMHNGGSSTDETGRWKDESRSAFSRQASSNVTNRAKGSASTYTHARTHAHNHHHTSKSTRIYMVTM